MRVRATFPEIKAPEPETVVDLTWPREKIDAVIALYHRHANDSHGLVVAAGREFGLRPNTTYRFFVRKP